MELTFNFRKIIIIIIIIITILYPKLSLRFFIQFYVRSSSQKKFSYQHPMHAASRQKISSNAATVLGWTLLIIGKIHCKDTHVNTF